MRIRRGAPKDSGFIRDVALAVFTQFGPYGRLLPGWLLHPEVITFLAEEDDGTPTGYAMLALRPFDDEELASHDASGLVDLVAIAVAPTEQGRGIGRMLLRHALEAARRLAPAIPVREVRLSVAEPNESARRLFESEGFVTIDPEHGYYAGGQRSLRMTRAIDSAAPAARIPVAPRRPAR